MNKKIYLNQVGSTFLNQEPFCLPKKNCRSTFTSEDLFFWSLLCITRNFKPSNPCENLFFPVFAQKKKILKHIYPILFFRKYLLIQIIDSDSDQNFRKYIRKKLFQKIPLGPFKSKCGSRPTVRTSLNKLTKGNLHKSK